MRFDNVGDKILSLDRAGSFPSRESVELYPARSSRGMRFVVDGAVEKNGRLAKSAIDHAKETRGEERAG